ncbi:hypothetical protein BO99DRAFT_44068 [Aspergillus violaceofuscus CBS 115571]|uniref:Uncharacterized protein n=1 Tax=Aspergillus violaceofuscus (strain CBS 115571) TaxID=1450538 RepID=A0A2V5I0J8_ASPV1|nr:hypothetical protein BO99DRAFT_44068 [Aspergillus violaceofuscus CBS 115571]
MHHYHHASCPFPFLSHLLSLTHIIVLVPILCFVLLSESTHSTTPLDYAPTYLSCRYAFSTLPSLRSDLPFCRVPWMFSTGDCRSAIWIILHSKTYPHCVRKSQNHDQKGEQGWKEEAEGR